LKSSKVGLQLPIGRIVQYLKANKYTQHPPHQLWSRPPPPLRASRIGTSTKAAACGCALDKEYGWIREHTDHPQQRALVSGYCWRVVQYPSTPILLMWESLCWDDPITQQVVRDPTRCTPCGIVCLTALPSTTHGQDGALTALSHHRLWLRRRRCLTPVHRQSPPNSAPPLGWSMAKVG
jgi:hypothetical protein